jgi:hypothetical protein
MFSLYEIGDFLLAFYTDIPSGPFSAIEIVDSDDTIFEIGAIYIILYMHVGQLFSHVYCLQNLEE